MALSPLIPGAAILLRPADPVNGPHPDNSVETLHNVFDFAASSRTVSTVHPMIANRQTIELLETAEACLPRCRLIVAFTSPATSTVTRWCLSRPSVAGVIRMDDADKAKFDCTSRGRDRDGQIRSRWTLPSRTAFAVVVFGRIHAVGLRIAWSALRRNVKFFTFIDPERKIATTYSIWALLNLLVLRSVKRRLAAAPARLSARIPPTKARIGVELRWYTKGRGRPHSLPRPSSCR